MPRANRTFVPGLVWHITHRCHKQEFLLKFQRDRERWRYWLFQAKRRYGLAVLNYIVTCNHVHLLVADDADRRIARSMQLIAGRTAQEYNLRKGRKGAFWEDRYHATAVEANDHLIRCLAYIDLNMVRAGVVAHPGQWASSGYHEIQRPPRRYAIINRELLASLCGIARSDQLALAHRGWVDAQLGEGRLSKQPEWATAIAVGSAPFVERVQTGLGPPGRYRRIERQPAGWCLREAASLYGPFGGEKSTSKAKNELAFGPIHRPDSDLPGSDPG